MTKRIEVLFGIQYPIIQGGMVWCAGHRLAAAVSAAGGLGLIGAGSMTPELVRQHIHRAREATSRPVGVNIPLIYRHAPDFIDICIEERVPIVFTSAGSPKTYTARLKAHSITVVHVAPNVTLARKCQDAGVDAIVVEGFEAGGHNGQDELTTMVLIPQVVDAVNIPVIAAGGIADGRAMAAAFALGAEGIQMGTRFAVSQESSAAVAFKDTVVQATDTATRLLMKKVVPVRLLLNEFARRVIELEKKGADREELQALLGRGRARRGIFEGDLAEGELEIGQIAGLIADIPPAAEIIRQVIAEYEATRAGLPTMMPSVPQAR